LFGDLHSNWGLFLTIIPFVWLESFLEECQRRTGTPWAPFVISVKVVDALAREVGLRTCDLSFADVAEVACEQEWTRDPFDRIIVSHARLRGVPLLTKDAEIHDNFDEAVWS